MPRSLLTSEPRKKSRGRKKSGQEGRRGKSEVMEEQGLVLQFWESGIAINL